MFSFLFKKKNTNDSSDPSENTTKVQSLSSLIGEINNLKEENERKKIHIEALEKQVNQQQIQILNLKKSLRDLKKNLSQSIENTKLSVDCHILNKSLARSICSEIDTYTEASQQDELLTSMSLFEDVNSSEKIFEPMMRSSFSLRELEIRPVDKERQNLNKFLNCIKLASPSVFKEIKAFIYNKEKLPFCNEIYDFIDKIHQKLEKSTKFVQTWGLFSEDLLEDLVFEGIYSRVFNVDEDTHARSVQIHEKLLVLQNIITPDLLEIPSKYLIPSVLLQLQNDIKKINERKSPKKKLQIIAHCFVNMIKLYETDNDNYQRKPPNADDLFPILVLIVLNANPENFYSNIEFINKYIRQNCLIGEEGYMLTNVKSAIFFLENLDGLGLRQGKLKLKPRLLDESML